jgi:thioredoxin-dependent peroxiredoxin
VQLQRDIKAIKAAGIRVVAISYDSPKLLKKFAREQKVSFPLLSDPKSQVIKTYGVLNENAKGRQEGIPFPGTFLVGTDGKVKAFLPGTTRRRHTTKELIDAAMKAK